MDIKCIEYSTLKIPYENLNKKYRNSLKNIDRDFNHIQSFLNESENIIKGLNDTNSDSLNTICDIVLNIAEKLIILKKKAKENLMEELEAVKQCKTRTDHLIEGFLLNHYLAKRIKEQDNNNVLQENKPFDNNINKEEENSDVRSDGDLNVSNMEVITDQPADEKFIYSLENKYGFKFNLAPEDLKARFNLWKKKRMDRMLIEYFLRHGYYDTALHLAEYSGIQDLTNIDLFLTAKEIEKSLLQQKTSPCLHWCYDNKSKLRKIKSNLEFELRIQEFIQLFQRSLAIEAIKYGRKFFTSFCSANSESFDEGNYKEIKKVMGLLAFNPTEVCEVYKEFLSEDRWTDLVFSFRDAICKMYQLDKQSIFCVALQAGLASLKTPQCKINAYHSENEKRNYLVKGEGTECIKLVSAPSTAAEEYNRCKSDDKSSTVVEWSRCKSDAGLLYEGVRGESSKRCPICNSKMGLLSKNLPFTHSTQSRLICRIGREILDDKNPPLILPNGQIYGKKALEQMASLNQNKITCPVTQQIYEFTEIEKVYIM